MNDPSMSSQNQTTFSDPPAGIVLSINVGTKNELPSFYAPNFNAPGLSLLLMASLSSSALFSLYDLGMDYKHAGATTVSAKIDFQEAVANKKRISAKEAGRLALLNLEKAEARRRKYVEDLARIQPDFKE